MKNDVIINGISVNELYKQRLAIKQEAAKIVSDNLEQAKLLTWQLSESEDPEEVKMLAEQAYEALHTAHLVSEVSGITYYLAYSSDYDSPSDIFSRVLQDYDNPVLSDNESVKQLADLFSSMESNSAGWNSSWC